MENLSYGTNSIFNTHTWHLIQEEISKPSLNMEVAKIGDAIPYVDNRLRISDIAFLDNMELDQQLLDMIIDWNNNISKWKWNITSLEFPQYGIYNKGGYYGWHRDVVHPNSPDYDPNIVRKISISIWLNDPDEYEGGELDIEVGGPRDDLRYHTFKLPKGSIIVFPSNSWHRVRPITSGVRKSLVVWFSGPPFR